MERVILITGASSGIGAAVCRRVAAPGTSILLHARGGKSGEKRALLEALADEARAKGAKVETRFADLEQPGAATGLVEAAIDSFGQLDQVVANAGFALRQELGEVSRAELDRSLNAMAGSYFDMVTAGYDQLAASKCGRVIAVSSFVAHVFKPGQLFPVTAAAKGAIEALSKNLAVQLAACGTTVNVVAPGYTRKEATGHAALSSKGWEIAAELTPLKHIAEPDDIAAAIAFLLSPEARHITGQTIHVDGGLTLG